MTSEEAETDAIAIPVVTLFPCLSRHRVMYLGKESILRGGCPIRDRHLNAPFSSAHKRQAGKTMGTLVHFFLPVVRVDRWQRALQVGPWSLQSRSFERP